MRPPEEQQARLVANATSLMMATVSTAGLGLVYWAVAARVYEPAEVGTGSALVAAASLLAALAQLGVGSLFMRHLPRGGAAGRRLAVGGLSLCAAVAAVLAGAYVASGSGGSFMAGADRLVFIVGVPVLAVFALQDFALLAVGAAPLVAIENAVFSVVKVVLLYAMATQVVVSGVFSSWIIAALLAVVSVLWIAMKRLLPGTTDAGPPLPGMRAMSREAGTQYLVLVADTMATYAIPLVVVTQLGTQAAGHFTIPWMIGLVLTVLNVNTLSALRVHATSGNTIDRTSIVRAVSLLGLVSGLGALVIGVFAPWVVTLAAPGYPPESVTLLRLLCVAAPLRASWMLLSAFFWVEQRLGLVLRVEAAYAAAMLMLAWILTAAKGVVGVGLAAVLASSLVAAAGAAPLARRLAGAWRRVPEPDPLGEPAPTRFWDEHGIPLRRVLHLNLGRSAPQVDGIQTAVHSLAGAQTSSGMDVTILDNGWRSDRGIIGCIRAACAEVESRSPALVHMHSVYRPVHAVVAGLLVRKGVPFVVSPHSGLSRGSRSRQRVRKDLWLAIAERHVLRRAGAVLCLSEVERADVLSVQPRARTFVVPNIAPPLSDVVPSTRGSGNRAVLVTLARYDVLHKGLDRIVAIGRGIPEADFVIYGQVDHNRPGLARALIAEAPRNVRFEPPVAGEDKVMALNGASMYLQPSRWEGMSMSVIEAMSMRVPCAVSGYVASTFGDGGRVMVTVLPDDPVEAIPVLRDALAHPDHISDQADRAAAWVSENLSGEAVVAASSAAYSSASGCPQRGRTG